MAKIIENIRVLVRSALFLPRPFKASDWNNVAKWTVARFSRGNIAAQQGRILFPDEQKEEHKRARQISGKWQKPENPAH